MPEPREAWGYTDIIATNSLLAVSALAAAAGSLARGERRLSFFPAFIPLYVAFMHVFLLRKTLCRNCHYYGEDCCTGWGKLAPLWCEKGDEGNFSQGMPLAAAFWATYPVLGAGGILRAFRRDRDTARLRHLVLFTLSFLGFNLWHIFRACPYCHHREECPKGMMALAIKGKEV
ncbi:MAG: hypothetical protein JW854_16805 [Actinobacteria bacterium]|nr:hypothetical protein [Actinomycetota bacterium]